MKRFIQIFKVPLIIFVIFLVAGITCKIITDRRPKVEFVRNNPQCTTERVFDYADKLTEEEEQILREKIRVAEESCGTDIVIVIVEQSLEEYAKSYESKIGLVEPYQYTMVLADNFYDENAFGYNEPHGDGVIFVDNWYREADGGIYSWLSTSGRAEYEMSEDDIELTLDLALENVDEDPAYAYGRIVEMVADDLNPNIALGDGLGGGISVLVGLVAGLIFFLLNMGRRKGKNTVPSKAYVKSGSANILNRQDIYLTKTITRRKIETENRSSGGGGGGHISAGGFSHGGGGHRR